VTGRGIEDIENHGGPPISTGEEIYDYENASAVPNRYSDNLPRVVIPELLANIEEHRAKLATER
jgi:hypothetical protein